MSAAEKVYRFSIPAETSRRWSREHLEAVHEYFHARMDRIEQAVFGAARRTRQPRALPAWKRYIERRLGAIELHVRKRGRTIVRDLAPDPDQLVEAMARWIFAEMKAAHSQH